MRTLVVVLATALGAASPLAVAGQERVYDSTLSVYVEGLFPKGMTPDQIADTYYKGNFGDDELKGNIAKALAHGKQPISVHGSLRAGDDGDSYYYELLGVGLPEGSKSVRMQWVDKGTVAQWAVHSSKTHDVGHLDVAGTEALTWKAAYDSLLGRAPGGKAASVPNLSSAQAAYAQSDRPNEARFAVVTYTDPKRSGVKRIQCYWNSRAKSPFLDIGFKDSRIEAGRHAFKTMTVLRFSNDTLQSEERFSLKSEQKTYLPFVPEIPKNAEFLDRRLGLDRTHTFFYDGKELPTVEDTQKLLAEQAKVERGPDRTPTVQFVFGSIFAFSGVALWTFAKRKP